MSPAIRILFAALTAGATVAATSLYRSGRAQPSPAAQPVSTVELSQPGDLRVLWNVPDFSLTDQDNQPVASKNLHGKIWIADFVFAGCAGSCRTLSLKMSQLQQAIPDSRIHFVSFDVDPDHDGPARLKEFATTCNADTSRWHFLGFPSRSAAFAFAKGMRATAKQDDRDFQILHSDHFILIDADGRVRGVYDATKDAGFRQLSADAKRLVDEG